MRGQTPPALVREVRERAADHCEYCRLPQDSQEATFHVDHIQPRSAGGPTSSSNLSLACVSCSLHKAARRFAEDPETGKQVHLFHPRCDIWREHFRVTSDFRIEGPTPAGRATVTALKMNRPAIVAIRSELYRLGRFPLP